MKIIDAETIAFIQAMLRDDKKSVLTELRKRCPGVDKIAMISRAKDGDAKTTVHTFWFKGHNGKKVVRNTWAEDLL